ncbi:heterokaryon incompatibility protein-domain-containing protein [Stachybotrys elegans]|uniref:Heterokaryon incompatibility protein-domain-containing protein n=1 Tax=Stachybotrys elegans TaxID=80388 RepID=A0A8K0WJH1_9HYPO|nr:heterokaryon incompatibility protein-domain-containing protein [Stachybotrys elegans]
MVSPQPDPEATITLLTLHPSVDDDSPIHCDTWSVALSAEPHYEALSYVWGDPAKSAILRLNGQQVQVSQNLSAALRHLRTADAALILWIDQLCIDQQNALEKSRQVRLMRHIYSKCSLCHVWIGEIPDDVTLDNARWIFEAFEYMADYHTAGNSECKPLPSLLAQVDDYEGKCRALSSLAGGDKSRQQVSWWFRIWTIQEAILPPDLRFMWGSLSIPLRIISPAVLSLTTGHSHPALYPFVRNPQIRVRWDILVANFAWIHDVKLKPVGVLSRMFLWRHRYATDPRDKAYAILGLCPKGALPRTEQCDYELPVSRVFANLTIDLILLEKYLRPLAADLKSKKSTSMPGWTFNVSHNCDYETDWHYLYSYDYYSACGSRKLDCQAFEKRMAHEPDALQIPGSHADFIACVIGAPMVHNRHDELTNKDYQECLENWRRISEEYCCNKLTFWEDFGRTMLGDLIRKHNQRVERRVTTDDVSNLYDFITKNIGTDVFKQTIRRNIGNQVFFVTDKGMLGLGYMDTKVGDEIWILDGGNMPFTLRRSNLDEVDFDYGGKCYIHGLMSGEFMAAREGEMERFMVRMH